MKTLYLKFLKFYPNRTPSAIQRQIARVVNENHLTKPNEKLQVNLRIGYLDIETTNLNADFGFILNWYIKVRDKEKYHRSIITKEEIFQEKYDQRLIKELMEALKKFDIIYTHYGGIGNKRFDTRYIIARAARYKLLDKFRHLGHIFIRDTYDIARRLLKIHSYRLGSIADALQITGTKEGLMKTPVTGHMWNKAMFGNKKALKYVDSHCKSDVMLLEEVHKGLEILEKKKFATIGGPS